MLKVATLGLCTIVAIAVAAIASDRDVHHEVAGNKFEIPTEYLFAERIFFLPAPAEDSFVFLLEPNPDRGKIPDHRILVQRLSRFCPGRSEALRVSCGQLAQPTAKVRYERRDDSRGSPSSTLVAIANSPEGTSVERSVGRCLYLGPNPAKPEPTHLCTTSWSYKGMLLETAVDERELSNLAGLKEQANALLEKWRVD